MLLVPPAEDGDQDNFDGFDGFDSFEGAEHEAFSDVANANPSNNTTTTATTTPAPNSELTTTSTIPAQKPDDSDDGDEFSGFDDIAVEPVPILPQLLPQPAEPSKSTLPPAPTKDTHNNSTNIAGDNNDDGFDDFEGADFADIVLDVPINLATTQQRSESIPPSTPTDRDDDEFDSFDGFDGDDFGATFDNIEIDTTPSITTPSVQPSNNNSTLNSGSAVPQHLQPTNPHETDVVNMFETLGHSSQAPTPSLPGTEPTQTPLLNLLNTIHTDTTVPIPAPQTSTKSTPSNPYASIMKRMGQPLRSKAKQAPTVHQTLNPSTPTASLSSAAPMSTLQDQHTTTHAIVTTRQQSKQQIRHDPLLQRTISSLHHSHQLATALSPYNEDYGVVDNIPVGIKPEKFFNEKNKKVTDSIQALQKQVDSLQHMCEASQLEEEMLEKELNGEACGDFDGELVDQNIPQHYFLQGLDENFNTLPATLDQSAAQQPQPDPTPTPQLSTSAPLSLTTTVISSQQGDPQLHALNQRPIPPHHDSTLTEAPISQLSSTLLRNETKLFSLLQQQDSLVSKQQHFESLKFVRTATNLRDSLHDFMVTLDKHPEVLQAAISMQLLDKTVVSPNKSPQPPTHLPPELQNANFSTNIAFQFDLNGPTSTASINDQLMVAFENANSSLQKINNSSSSLEDEIQSPTPQSLDDFLA